MSGMTESLVDAMNAALSTTIPIAKTIPKRVRVLMENPMAARTETAT